MKRSMQEIVELVVFGLIAVLLGTGVLWLVGWLLGLLGGGLIWLAGLVWAVLRFIVPVAIVAGIVYLVVRLVQQQDARSGTATAEPAGAEPRPAAAEPPPARPAATESPSEPAAPPPPPAPEGAHEAGVPVGDEQPSTAPRPREGGDGEADR